MKTRYGQYCPIAMATEILGDRWTLLIIRDLLAGGKHFNDLERGLPGISRGLLTQRLKRLCAEGLLSRKSHGKGRRTVYSLTAAGSDLYPVIDALTNWGAKWAFGEPTEEQLDPVLLMWWMRDRVHRDRIPGQRTVVQFDFHHRRKETFWLLLTRKDVSICLTHPGFETDVLVTANLKVYFQVWLGRMRLADAMESRAVRVDAIPALARSFPKWFAWSPVAPAIRAAMAEKSPK